MSDHPVGSVEYWKTRAATAEMALADMESARDAARASAVGAAREIDSLQARIERASKEANVALKQSDGALKQSLQERNMLFEECEGLRREKKTLANALRNAEMQRDEAQDRGPLASALHRRVQQDRGYFQELLKALDMTEQDFVSNEADHPLRRVISRIEKICKENESLRGGQAAALKEQLDAMTARAEELNRYTAQVNKERDEAIRDLRSKTKELSEALDRAEKAEGQPPQLERDWKWARAQIDAGHAVTHPMLDCRQSWIQKIGDGPRGPIYEINNGCRWIDVGGNSKLAEVAKQAEFTYNWKITHAGR